MPSPPKTATEIKYQQLYAEAMEAQRRVAQSTFYNQYTGLLGMSPTRTPSDYQKPAPAPKPEPPDPAAARFSKLQLD